MSLLAHLQSLGQRFDGVALRPPADAAEVTEVDYIAATATPAQRASSTHAALQAWCWCGAGPGNTALWQPGTQPRVAARLQVAALLGKAGEPLAATIAWADAFARQLDGSNRLAALPGRAAGLAFRLGVKLHDAAWWRTRQPSDPWDAGWAINSAPALRQLQDNFQPRRATLILADARHFEPLNAGLAAWAQRQAGLRHPVRWLWVGDKASLPAPQGLAMTEITLV